ncbi:PLP-dependent aminotransferase family protein [Motiliproteus coralliicola]|uniref:PLP-dependent aminotransferase family protein n=1 Tax=Motiliproteus coralliicola TaxID=2283196 RepID=A0A369WWN1_9GAMM|nr:PLP-dependent aminotransferase family protein [Motiliproteus coralliicola]RDE24954.1 PLP-dependent aminotransferase family protein [Motiliproteus coralliicola]
MTIMIEAIRSQLPAQTGPRYRRIALAICAAVDSGQLQSGDKLPTHRNLAEHLGVSVQTVSFAYAHAEQQGYVHGKVGSGTYVGHRQAEQQAEFLKPGSDTSDTLIDLSIASAIAGNIQQQAFSQTLQEIANSPEGTELITVVKPFAGLPRHRQAASRWLDQQGIEASADQICLCNGVTHGLMIALSSLVKPGGIVACEALVDHGLIALARTLNIKLEGVEIDAEGMVPEALEHLCQQRVPDALCLTPNLHNPTSATQSESRRQALAAVARHYGIAVVEDDIFGPLSDQKRRPIAAYLPDNSYYLSGFSKALASGLRLGYLVPPKGQLDAVVGRLRASSWMASPMTAEVASRWIDDGTASRLADWQRRTLLRRQQLAADILSGFDYLAAPNGPLIWLALPEAWRAESFISQARARGVSLTGAEPFVVGHQAAPHSIRISVSSATSEAALVEGLKRLTQLLQEQPPPLGEGIL